MPSAKRHAFLTYPNNPQRPALRHPVVLIDWPPIEARLAMRTVVVRCLRDGCLHISKLGQI